MINESQIILKAFLEKREDYEKFAPYVLGLKNMDRGMFLMLTFIKAFYDKYPKANTCPETELRLYLSSYDSTNFIGNHDQYIKDTYLTLTTNRALTMDIIEGCVEKHLMSKVIDKAAAVLDNNKKGILSNVQDDIDEYHTIIRQPPQDMSEYKLDLKTLIREEITNIGIPFVNNKPNDIIRGFRKGHLGLIYAYVDTGKTSYGVANLCSIANYLHQNKSTRPVVYGCNEEDVSRVSLRAIQCMTNWSDPEIEANEKLVTGLIKAKGFDTIKFIDHVNTMRTVDKILAKHNPRVLFIDQGTKVRVPGQIIKDVNTLEEIFGGLRERAKKAKCTIVCMAQGGEGCFNKKNPDLRDIYGSKSAIQGALDWGISIGIDSEDVKYANYRYFNVTKNKGDKATYVCKFDYQRCQFRQVA